MKKIYTLFSVLLLLMLTACGETDDSTVFTAEPTQASAQYITVNDKQMELIGSAELIAGYTTDTLVQFKDFYDFGLRDERPLGFSGTGCLNGNVLSSSEYRFDGYPDNTTIVLKLFRDLQLKDNVLTVEAGSVIFYGDQAMELEKTFQAVWDGETWSK